MRRFCGCGGAARELTGMWHLSTMLLCPRTSHRRSHDGVAGNGGVVMKSLDREVTVTGRAGAGSTHADRETSQRGAEAAYEEKKTAEKPRWPGESPSGRTTTAAWAGYT